MLPADLSLHDMDRLLVESLDTLQRVDQQLLSLVAHRSALQLHDAMPQQSTLQEHAHSAQLAAQATAHRLNTLIQAQDRVKHTIKQVDMLLDLKHTITQVKLAIQHGDLANAAKNTHRILDPWKRERKLQVRFGDQDGEISFEALEALEEQLRKRVVQECQDKLTQEHALDDVLQLARLYPLIGLNKPGLDIYCNTVVSSINNKLKSLGLTLAAHPKGAQVDHLKIVPEILDTYSAFLKEHIALIQSNFGAGAHLLLLQMTQKSVDLVLVEILKNYSVNRKLASLAKNVQKASISTDHDDGKKGDVQDFRQLDEILEELAFLCKETEVFDLELRKAAADAVQILSEQNQELAAEYKVLNLQHVSKTNEFVQELNGFYIALEEHFMLKSVRKAVEINEKSSNSLFSTVVDDTFFVLRKCITRSFSMYNIGSLCAIINIVNDVLTKDYIESFKSEITALASSSNPAAGKMQAATTGFASKILAGSGMASGGIPKKTSKISIFTIINNLDKSREFLDILKHQMEEEFRQVFPSSFLEFAKQEEIFNHCLGELSHVSSTFVRLADKTLRQQSQVLEHKISAILDNLQTHVEFEIQEKVFADYEVNDPFANELILSLQKSVSSYENVLIENFYESILQMLSEYVCSRIEKSIFQKKFTFWGALQLDKDVRKIMNFFTSKSKRPIRETFLRITQICSILQLESVREMLDYWTDSADWKLTPDEVKKVMNRRVDFTLETINSLALQSFIN